MSEATDLTRVIDDMKASIERLTLMRDRKVGESLSSATKACTVPDSGPYISPLFEKSLRSESLFEMIVATKGGETELIKRISDDGFEVWQSNSHQIEVCSRIRLIDRYRVRVRMSSYWSEAHLVKDWKQQRDVTLAVNGINHSNRSVGEKILMCRLVRNVFVEGYPDSGLSVIFTENGSAFLCQARSTTSYRVAPGTYYSLEGLFSHHNIRDVSVSREVIDKHSYTTYQVSNGQN